MSFLSCTWWRRVEEEGNSEGQFSTIWFPNRLEGPTIISRRLGPSKQGHSLGTAHTVTVKEDGLSLEKKSVSSRSSCSAVGTELSTVVLVRLCIVSISLPASIDEKLRSRLLSAAWTQEESDWPEVSGKPIDSRLYCLNACREVAVRFRLNALKFLLLRSHPHCFHKISRVEQKVASREGLQDGGVLNYSFAAPRRVKESKHRLFHMLPARWAIAVPNPMSVAATLGSALSPSHKKAVRVTFKTPYEDWCGSNVDGTPKTVASGVPPARDFSSARSLFVKFSARGGDSRFFDDAPCNNTHEESSSLGSIKCHFNCSRRLRLTVS
ncbi:hypothetical protein KC354_g3 [Hortaea werneckii]|nr:hypothetical protein KC354_g3 [Hortaea werneckii]